MADKIETNRLSLLNPESYRSWKSWTENRFGISTDVDARSFRAELELAGISLDDEKQSVLEIGFGNGTFASWVVSQGWQYIGTELDEELIARARAIGLEAHEASMKLSNIASGRKFDLIVAFDVLEHLTIYEIIDLLLDAKALLVPGGKFVARFPSGDSPFARAWQYGDMTHQSVIGSGIVAQIALKSGFRVVQIRAPAFPIFGFGMRRAVRRMGVVAIRSVLKRIVNLAFHDNKPKVVEPNMVIVLESSSLAATTAD